MMTNKHPKYKKIKQEFLAGRDISGGQGPPAVVRVWQVRNPQLLWLRYSEYEQKVGHKNRRFHDTSMKCSFGVDIEQRPCNDPQCSVCSTCEKGFRLDHARSGPRARGFARLNGELRYTAGLYFSKHSSKSHDYAFASERPLHAKAAAAATSSGSIKPKKVRCMFLCRVALGRELRTDQEMLGEKEVCCQQAVLRPSCAAPAFSFTRQAWDDLGASPTS
jgi:hypothetical protein